MKLKKSRATLLVNQTVQLQILLFVLAIMPVVVSAETTDGQTPAQEGICDQLNAEGVTKGLYGLCVAYCEAQDLADENTPMTEEEISELLEDIPSNRILKNYNKRRTESDPEMPCIVPVPDASCPCISLEEFEKFDGLSDYDESRSQTCRSMSTETRFSLFEGRGHSFISGVQGTELDEPYCRFSSVHPRVYSYIYPISVEEYDACVDLILSSSCYTE